MAGFAERRETCRCMRRQRRGVVCRAMTRIAPHGPPDIHAVGMTPLAGDRGVPIDEGNRVFAWSKLAPFHAVIV